MTINVYKFLPIIELTIFMYKLEKDHMSIRIFILCYCSADKKMLPAILVDNECCCPSSYQAIKSSATVAAPKGAP